jgi:hypothetical protein
MDNQSSALIYQHSLNLLAFRGLRNASHRCIRAARSLDFEEIIAMPAIFMIISQHFDVEHDKRELEMARMGQERRKSGGRIMIDSCKETMTLSVEEKRQHDRFAKRIIASASVGKKKSLF